MNYTKTIIIMIVILFIILFVFKNQEQYENFTNDEAIQNVASLYNSGLATVTNLNAISTLKTPSLTSDGRLHISGPEYLYLLNKSGVIIGKEWGGNGNLTVSGDTNVSGGINAGNYINTKGNGSGGTHIPYTDGNNYLTSNNNILRGGPTSVQGDLNVSGNTTLSGNTSVNGILNPTKGMVGIVLDAPTWDVGTFVSQIKPYFNANQPDGTFYHFFFLNPNKSNVTNVWHGVAVKLGKQYLLYQNSPDHNGTGNVMTSGSNNATWRGNI